MNLTLHKFIYSTNFKYPRYNNMNILSGLESGIFHLGPTVLFLSHAGGSKSHYMSQSF